MKNLSVTVLAMPLGGYGSARDDLISLTSSESKRSKYPESDGAVGDIAFYSEI